MSKSKSISVQNWKIWNCEVKERQSQVGVMHEKRDEEMEKEYLRVMAEVERYWVLDDEFLDLEIQE